MNKLKSLLLKKRQEKEKMVFTSSLSLNAQPPFSTSVAHAFLPYVFQMHSKVGSFWFLIFHESLLISNAVGSLDFNMVHL